jgi:hypothetical protein
MSHFNPHSVGLRDEIARFLESVKDHGTSIDTGAGLNGCGDLWVTVQGAEYFISIRQSSKVGGAR